MDSDLEAFSHNPTHGSFAALAFPICQPQIPIMRINGSSRTKLNYYCDNYFVSRVKLLDTTSGWFQRLLTHRHGYQSLISGPLSAIFVTSPTEQWSGRMTYWKRKNLDFCTVWACAPDPASTYPTHLRPGWRGSPTFLIDQFLCLAKDVTHQTAPLFFRPHYEETLHSEVEEKQHIIICVNNGQFIQISTPLRFRGEEFDCSAEYGWLKLDKSPARNTTSITCLFKQTSICSIGSIHQNPQLYAAGA
jgi:hypothetical protein